MSFRYLTKKCSVSFKEDISGIETFSRFNSVRIHIFDSFMFYESDDDPRSDKILYDPATDLPER